MKKIVIHCGIPYTNSQNLQAFLLKNRTYIRVNYEFDYIDLPSPESVTERVDGNADFLARAFLDLDHPKSLTDIATHYVDSVLARLSGPSNNIILSSDYFSDLSNEAFELLLKLLGRIGHIQLLYFIRNPFDLFDHMYAAETINLGNCLLPEEYFSKIKDSFLKETNYMDRFSSLLDVVPKACSMTLIPYEITSEEKVSSNQIFLQSIGITKFQLQTLPWGKLNPSPILTKICYELNKISMSPSIMRQVISDVDSGKLPKQSLDSTYMPPHIIKEIDELLRKANEEFFAEFYNSENKYSMNKNSYIDMNTYPIGEARCLQVIGSAVRDLDRRMASIEALNR